MELARQSVRRSNNVQRSHAGLTCLKAAPNGLKNQNVNGSSIEQSAFVPLTGIATIFV
jgi:hypothetical protein